ncbi:MAG: glycosyltransferase family 2 protein [Candidatus Omnitrophota bacterium]
MKKHETAITIGIPAYQRPEYTRLAVESCLNQNYSNYNILLQDDSPDGELAELLRGFSSPRFAYAHNPQRLGLARNANVILEKARGTWMLFLANDDLLEPGYLAALNDIISKYPEAALIRTRYRLISTRGQSLRLDRKNPFREDALGFLEHLFLPLTDSSLMNISAVAFPTENFRKIGGFKDLHGGHHIDRLAWAGLAQFGDVLCIPDPLARIRVHPGQLSIAPDIDYPAALRANRDMENCFEEIFRRFSARDDPARGVEHLAQVRSRFQHYCRRQNQRALDQGLCAAIETRKIRSVKDLRTALSAVRKHGIPFFPSLLFYQCLLLLPSGLRTSCLKTFKQIKFKRWFT